MDEPTITDDVPERVRRGAKLLDERRPGWAAEIDAGTLRVRYCTHCVLGQLFGHYESGLRSVGLTDEFRAPSPWTGEGLGFGALNGGIEWERLDDAWRAEIAARTRAGD